MPRKPSITTFLRDIARFRKWLRGQDPARLFKTWSQEESALACYLKETCLIDITVDGFAAVYPDKTRVPLSSWAAGFDLACDQLRDASADGTVLTYNPKAALAILKASCVESGCF